jgi:predicted transcriptional regulator
MTTPLEDIEWLTQSEHRVAVFRAIASKPHTNRELRESLGVSQVTMRRILTDMDEKAWAESEGWEHSATPLGELVLSRLSPLVDAAAISQNIDEVAEWLPTSS